MIAASEIRGYGIVWYTLDRNQPRDARPGAHYGDCFWTDWLPVHSGSSPRYGTLRAARKAAHLAARRQYLAGGSYGVTLVRYRVAPLRVSRNDVIQYV